MNKVKWFAATFFVVAFLFVAFGCSKAEVDIIKGDNGKDGTNGANGHSLVSQFISASELECSTGGTRLDIYLDLDDNLSLNEEDLYQGSLVACNGANGLNGVQGLQGTEILRLANLNEMEASVEVNENDILVFRNAGAYCFEMSMNYNSRTKPAEILVDGADIHLIRKAQVFEDLQKDVIEI
jgi:hypothetical protein